MNSKDEYLRRPFEQRDYSFDSKSAIQSSAKKSYYEERESQHKKLQEDDTELLAEYQLKRQRDKTRILDERLRNKEIFISQMKEFQRQLTRAFDESQQQLKYYKTKCQQFSSVQITKYIQEIEHLKQLLRTSQQSKRKIEEDIGRTKIQSKQKPSKSLQRSKTDSAFRLKQNDPRDINPLDFPKQFVGAFTNYPVNEVLINGSKLGKFMNHFLMMVETCNPEVSRQPLKQYLKFGWKWIKDVVKNSGRQNTSLDNNDRDQLLENIRVITNRKSIGQVIPFIQDTLYQTKHQNKVMKMIVSFYQLPQNTTIKQLQEFLKKKRQKH